MTIFGFEDKWEYKKSENAHYYDAFAVREAYRRFAPPGTMGREDGKVDIWKQRNQKNSGAAENLSVGGNIILGHDFAKEKEILVGFEKQKLLKIVRVASSRLGVS